MNLENVKTVAKGYVMCWLCHSMTWKTGRASRIPAVPCLCQFPEFCQCERGLCPLRFDYTNHVFMRTFWNMSSRESITDIRHFKILQFEWQKANKYTFLTQRFGVSFFHLRVPPHQNRGKERCSLFRSKFSETLSGGRSNSHRRHKKMQRMTRWGF